MAQPGKCVICLTPVTNHAIACDKPYTKQRQILTCPSCQHVVPLSVLEVLRPQVWKKDPEFVEQVKEVWKENPLWYGICYENENAMEGFWGELRDPYDANRKTLYFLGHTKSQVIPRMKTCLSFL